MSSEGIGRPGAWRVCVLSQQARIRARPRLKNRHVPDRHSRQANRRAPTSKSNQLTQRPTLLIASLLIAGLAGCAGGLDFGSTPQSLTWVRTDGQSGKANPALADQFSKDRSEYRNDRAVQCSADGGARPAGQRGYVLVSADQAEATAAKYRADTASKYTAKPAAH
jgi:hypothetical protein